MLFQRLNSFITQSNSFPNDKILDLSKLKEFAVNKSNVTKNLNFVLGKGKVKRSCGKWRKCWFSVFSHFPIVFSKGFFLQVINSLSHDKILDWSKLKTYADDKINVT